MDLSELLSSLAPGTDWTPCLAGLNVASPGDLLFASVETEVQRRAQRLVEDYLVADGSTAAFILARDSISEVPFTTGCPAFDALLDGHWNTGELVEISGSKGVGKSLLALVVVLRMLQANATTTALLIDTEGTFSAERVYSVLSRIKYPERDTPPPTTPRTREAELEHVLTRLHVTRRSSVPAVADALSSATAESENMGCTLCCIVIDAISTLYRDRLATGIVTQGHASMAALAQHLRAMATSALHPCLVMCVNDSVSAMPVAPLAVVSGTKRKPAMGPTWSHLTDWTVWLSSSAEMSVSEESRLDAQPRTKTLGAQIWRSRRMASGVWTPLRSDGLAFWDV